jgi:threonyl-tRNA synthetase
MSDDNLNQIRHSCAHLLAAAVQELYPKAKRTIGPAIESGFYYDFDFGEVKVSDEDLEKIENKMKELLPSWKSFDREEVSVEDAKKRFKDNEYKLELIEEFSGEDKVLSIYKSGNFEDLCRGGHSENPSKELGAFKLLSLAGAYWRGDEKNKMLTRIYGTCFATKGELDLHLQMLEEARKRDHRKLGRELDLFVFSDLVGKGLPLFTPKGTILREVLNTYSQELRLRKGFQKVWIPHITKNDLYKISGHWDKFGDELFLVKSQETSDEMVMKPMNCPHHQQIYASKPRSYKDLPIKYMETTTIYRDEKAGELNGLSRVRSATQDDGHSFCTPEQIEQVYGELIDIVKTFYKTVGMPLRARLSYRDPKTPEKYLGDIDLWEKAQNILLDIAKKHELDYYIAEGEAAFYGPKIDFMGMDAIGREWQVATPQLDFVQPSRFGLTYTDADGQEKTPVMIHFALMGSIERFLSVYIEHTAGAFPTWLAPVQVMMIPISDKHLEYAKKVQAELMAVDVRVEVDERSETMQSKIRDAQLQKIPYMLVVGDKEIEAKAVAVRKRGGENKGAQPLESFKVDLLTEISSKAL